MQSVYVFLDRAKFLDFHEKIMISAELKGCLT